MENAVTPEVVDYKKLYEESLLANEKLRKEKDGHILELEFQLDRFRKYIFGQKNEKLSTLNKEIDLSQLNLFDLATGVEEQEQASEKAKENATSKPVPKKRAKGTGRTQLPENLRRENIVLEPAEDVTDCVKIGEDITEVLDVIPAELYVKRYIRPKYAKPNNEGIITAELPERIIKKGIPSERLIAELVVDKYVYGMPLHRQIDKYARLGFRIPASSASDWIIKGWKHLSPLWELLKLLISQQKYLQVDETPIKVQDKNKKSNIHQGYMWVYNAPVDGLVYFDYRPGRDASGPKMMLKDFVGIVQTDGYKVYESLYSNHPTILLVYCMAHARRKFVEAKKYDDQKASFVLDKLSQLYQLEDQMRSKACDWQERTTIRQQKAMPILDELEEWMKEQSSQVLGSSPLGKAIGYALPRWKGLSAYVNHGQIEIDNNLAENAIRPIAIGRKNYLFAGSHDAAEMTAAMYSFMSTCKRNGVNEMEWLTDVFTRIQDHNHKHLYQLIPNNWKKYKYL